LRESRGRETRMDTPTSFGEYVKQSRERKGISAKKLAPQLGVALTTITRIEKGSIPEPDLFVSLIDVLDLDAITAVNLVPQYRRIYQRIMTALEGE
jgi:ribosome-binding protein aMBF1 (putative translation factor)